MRKEKFSKNRSPKKDWEYDIKVAIELHYPEKVLDLLHKESDPVKRQRILTDARNGKYDDSRK